MTAFAHSGLTPGRCEAVDLTRYCLTLRRQPRTFEVLYHRRTQRRASMQAYQADRQRDSADQDERHGPGRIQIEPAPRQEFQSQIAVD
jgi:hypothetical protein